MSVCSLILHLASLLGFPMLAGTNPGFRVVLEDGLVALVAGFALLHSTALSPGPLLKVALKAYSRAIAAGVDVLRRTRVVGQDDSADVVVIRKLDRLAGHSSCGGVRDKKKQVDNTQKKHIAHTHTHSHTNTHNNNCPFKYSCVLCTYVSLYIYLVAKCPGERLSARQQCEHGCCDGGIALIEVSVSLDVKVNNTYNIYCGTVVEVR